MNKKQTIGIAATVLVLIISMFLPAMGEISQVGMRTVGLLIAFLIVLVTEALPVVVICLITCAIMPLMGVVDGFGAALSGFSQPIVFFILASFGIAAALTTIPLSRRILRALLKKFGKNTNQVLISMMVCCALLSSIVSNVPTCAIFMALALDFIELYDNEEDKKRSGRAFMIAIPVASMIGGMMTPAGSSINLLALSQLEMHTGISVTFIQWMAAGIPLTIVMIPLAWFIMCKVYKPAPLTQEQVKGFVDSMDIPDKMDAKEKKVCVITIIMLILWIASSGIKGINVMVVAMLGCCAMFVPGIAVLDVKKFLRDNSWDAFFLVACVISIANAMINNGVSAAIANAIPQLNVSMVVLLGFTAVLIFVSLIIIPVAASTIPIMALPLINIAVNAGVNPALIMLSAALCAANCYLLPLDTVPLITYAKGYYSMTDMPKSTIWLQLAMVVLTAIWLPVVAGLIGL